MNRQLGFRDYHPGWKLGAVAAPPGHHERLIRWTCGSGSDSKRHTRIANCFGSERQSRQVAFVTLPSCAHNAHTAS